MAFPVQGSETRCSADGSFVCLCACVCSFVVYCDRVCDLELNPSHPALLHGCLAFFLIKIPRIFVCVCNTWAWPAEMAEVKRSPCLDESEVQGLHSCEIFNWEYLFIVLIVTSVTDTLFSEFEKWSDSHDKQHIVKWFIFHFYPNKTSNKYSSN